MVPVSRLGHNASSFRREFQVGAFAEAKVQDAIAQCGGAQSVGHMSHASIFGIAKDFIPFQIATSRDVTNATTV